VRFNSARAAGLDEDKVEQIADGYETKLTEAETAALKLTDAIIGDPRSLTDEQRNALKAHYTDAEIVELTLGVGLFLAMSKVLINLGLEPESMPTTLIPTPGS
jgi:alkylhydroperoxidase family enzyme